VAEGAGDSPRHANEDMMLQSD
jgi:hypothetical protein